MAILMVMVFAKDVARVAFLVLQRVVVIRASTVGMDKTALCPVLKTAIIATSAMETAQENARMGGMAEIALKNAQVTAKIIHVKETLVNVNKAVGKPPLAHFVTAVAPKNVRIRFVTKSRVCACLAAFQDILENSVT